jgi:hypothetical protein
MEPFMELSRRERLLHQLHELPAREPVSDGQRGDRHLQVRTEAAMRNTRRQLGAHRAAAVGTAEPLQAMLADLDGERR